MRLGMSVPSYAELDVEPPGLNVRRSSTFEAVLSRLGLIYLLRDVRKVKGPYAGRLADDWIGNVAAFNCVLPKRLHLCCRHANRDEGSTADGNISDQEVVPVRTNAMRTIAGRRGTGTTSPIA